MTLGSAVKSFALSVAPAHGLGQGAQLLGIAAVGLASGSVLLLDLSAGTLLAALGSHHTAITALAFAWVPSSSSSSSSSSSPTNAHSEGRGEAINDAGSLRLVSGSADGVLHVYALAPPDASSSRMVPSSSHSRNHLSGGSVRHRNNSNHDSHGKQQFDPTLGAATAMPALKNGGTGDENATGFELLPSSSPASDDETGQSSSSWAPLVPGCLPPKLLFSVQHLQSPLVWLGCPRDLSLLLCQVRACVYLTSYPSKGKYLFRKLHPSFIFH